jgi:phage shock protein B
MEDVLVPIIVIPTIFIGLPWLIFHYVTKWKTAGTLTNEDETMLDSMYETARRLEERLATVERIIAADNPDFRPSQPLRDTDDYRFERRN